jgi:hypothetical protein
MATTQTRKRDEKKRYLVLKKSRNAKNSLLDLTTKSTNRLDATEYVLTHDYKHVKIYNIYNDDDGFVIHRNKKEWKYKQDMIERLDNLKRVLLLKINISQAFLQNEEFIRKGMFTVRHATHFFDMFFDEYDNAEKIIYTFDDYLDKIYSYTYLGKILKPARISFYITDYPHPNFVKYQQLLVLRQIQKQKMNMCDDAFCDYWKDF